MFGFDERQLKWLMNKALPDLTYVGSRNYGAAVYLVSFRISPTVNAKVQSDWFSLQP